jgi:hypothetical protein
VIRSREAVAGEEKRTPGAEARVHTKDPSARMNSCPSRTPLELEFFSNV